MNELLGISGKHVASVTYCSQVFISYYLTLSVFAIMTGYCKIIKL